MVKLDSWGNPAKQKTNKGYAALENQIKYLLKKTGHATDASSAELVHSFRKVVPARPPQTPDAHNRAHQTPDACTHWVLNGYCI
jgi:hypothetical protein